MDKVLSQRCYRTINHGCSLCLVVIMVIQVFFITCIVYSFLINMTIVNMIENTQYTPSALIAGTANIKYNNHNHAK